MSGYAIKRKKLTLAAMERTNILQEEEDKNLSLGMQSSKLGEVEVFENPFATNDYIFETSPPSEVFENPFATDDYNDCDIFSPPTIEDIVYVDYDMPPIYDVYNDEYDIFSPSTIEDKIHYDYSMPSIYDDYNDGCDTFTPTITNETVYAYVESNITYMYDYGRRVEARRELASSFRA